MASLLQITSACKSYGDQILLDHAEATISDFVKVGFIGRNGAGKSIAKRAHSLLGEEELLTAAKSSAIRAFAPSAICASTIPSFPTRHLSNS